MTARRNERLLLDAAAEACAAAGPELLAPPTVAWDAVPAVRVVLSGS